MTHRSNRLHITFDCCKCDTRHTIVIEETSAATDGDDDSSISPMDFELTRGDDGRHHIICLGKDICTYVNGQRISGFETVLEDADVVRVGNREFAVHLLPKTLPEDGYERRVPPPVKDALGTLERSFLLGNSWDSRTGAFISFGYTLIPLVLGIFHFVHNGLELVSYHVLVFPAITTGVLYLAWLREYSKLKPGLSDWYKRKLMPLRDVKDPVEKFFRRMVRLVRFFIKWAFFGSIFLILSGIAWFLLNIMSFLATLTADNLTVAPWSQFFSKGQILAFAFTCSLELVQSGFMELKRRKKRRA